MRFFKISTEPPAIIQPRVRRMQYSTSVSRENYKTGIWKDFASDDGGADLISLVAYLRGIGQGDAARELADSRCRLSNGTRIQGRGRFSRCGGDDCAAVAAPPRIGTFRVQRAPPPV
jgi:hypothetical protein